jgi:hypothetical protein
MHNIWGNLIKGEVIHALIKVDMLGNLGMGSLGVIPNNVPGSASPQDGRTKKVPSVKVGDVLSQDNMG